jgi:hypothetical protein
MMVVRSRPPGAHAQPLVFRMEKSPLGKWPVGEIIFAGGDQQMRP